MVRRRDIRPGLVASPRQAGTALLLHLLERLCTDHVPMAGTRPVVCARCWRVIDEETA